VSEVFVERKNDGTYRALLNHRTIATGDTQDQTARRVRRDRPDAIIFVERVRETSGGSPDKWRRWYG
jgi:hypothetical protein